MKAPAVAIVATIYAVPATAFLLPSTVAPASFVTRQAVRPCYAHTNAPVVSMNLAERFMRVAKANLNSLLNNVEDPEKVLEQAVEDMQNDLVKVRQSYAQVTATQKRMDRQRTEAVSIGDKWYERAQLALEAGNEALAREALTRRQSQVEIADGLGAQMDQQQQAIEQLRSGMQTLEAKISEAKGKKDTLIARARSAKTNQSINDMLNNVTGSSGMEAFERMQQKVETLESTAEVSMQLSGTAGGSLEAQFKALEGNTGIDAELAKMKGALPGSSTASKSLPSGSSSANSEQLDDEIAQLKKELGR